MSTQATTRSIYRRLLRELPTRPFQSPPRTAKPTILSSPSPLQRHIRATIISRSSSTSSEPVDQQSSALQEAEQLLQYLQAQRQYVTLLERYNPGMNMDEEERVRLTARRVGMDLPVEVEREGGGEK